MSQGYQVATSVQSKLTFTWRGSACRYDCTFL